MSLTPDINNLLFIFAQAEEKIGGLFLKILFENIRIWRLKRSEQTKSRAYCIWFSYIIRRKILVSL